MVPGQALHGSPAEQALSPGPVFSPPQRAAGDAGRVNPTPPLQVTEDALVYSTFLLHNPRPVGNLSILRTNRAEVPIECRYPRSVWDQACCCPHVVQRPLSSTLASWQNGCEQVEGLWSLPSAPGGSRGPAESAGSL